MKEIGIRRLVGTDVNERVARGIDELMNHLVEKRSGRVDCDRLGRIVADGRTALFVAERGEEIVGTLTLVHYLTPVCNKFWIEDVVCAPSVRGLGVGRALVRHAIEYARRVDATATITLTSNPQRTAARGLYRSEGFEIYETDVFTYNK